MTSRPIYCPRCQKSHAFYRPVPLERPGATLRDVLEIVAGTAIFLSLLLGIPFLLWVVAS